MKLSATLLAAALLCGTASAQNTQQEGSKKIVGSGTPSAASNTTGEKQHTKGTKTVTAADGTTTTTKLTSKDMGHHNSVKADKSTTGR